MIYTWVAICKHGLGSDQAWTACVREKLSCASVGITWLTLTGTPSVCHYMYVVRIINPKKKSSFVVRNLHRVHERFESPESMKTKLKESFKDYLPHRLDFNIGYFEKHGSGKRWIKDSDDLEAMYDHHPHDNTITLWFEGSEDDPAQHEVVDKGQKRKSSPIDDDGNPVSSKRAKKEQQIDTIFETLREKHKETFSNPQLRLWARMQASGLHHDLDNPPNVPAITGRPVTKRKEKDKDDSFTDALTGAANAITKLLVGNQPATPNKTVANKPTGISPASKANLSGQYLQHLSSLQQLRQNSVLTEEEF